MNVYILYIFTYTVEIRYNGPEGTGEFWLLNPNVVILNRLGSFLPFQNISFSKLFSFSTCINRAQSICIIISNMIFSDRHWIEKCNFKAKNYFFSLFFLPTPNRLVN